MKFENIVEDIEDRTHLSAGDARAAVQVFIDIVTDELKNDGKVSLDHSDSYESQNIPRDTGLFRFTTDEILQSN